ncbi:protein ARABIDILLO 1 [Canna indica]|uniref:Protein ARABIDILLO 1 n=1 Tax=Canna indica TaxID=4628 RepID=A0AAQ3Q7C3_9LILI|nr:protein ARABIDILLO 1 [Canna indica]
MKRVKMLCRLRICEILKTTRVHETAAGALGHLVSQLLYIYFHHLVQNACFAYTFDRRTGEVTDFGYSLEGSSKSTNLDGARLMGLKHRSFHAYSSYPQVLSMIVASSTSTTLQQLVKFACIQLYKERDT